jgi:hypothetical protein
MPLGPREITVTCSDLVGNQARQTITVTGVDITPPDLQVTYPAPGTAIPLPDGQENVSVLVTGTARDPQSGMDAGSAGVLWTAEPNGEPAPATAVGSTFETWSTEVTLASLGANALRFWARDAAGNVMPDPLVVPVDLISSYVPSTLEERLDGRTYLESLLSFAQDQVMMPGSEPLTTGALVTALGQPWGRISEPLSAAADISRLDISQLRVPVELLRGYIAEERISTQAGADGEDHYRTVAYESLLAGAGTSYAEVRLARGASDDDRRAVADRIGIGLSPGRPDELDKLLIDGGALTEDALERLFGLPATAASLDPLRIPAAPSLLIWRLSRQVFTWAEQDQAPTNERTFKVILDPDVVTAADIATGPGGEAAGALLAARRATLDAYASALTQARLTAVNPRDGFAAMLAIGLPGVDLHGLDSAERAGVDISGQLDSAGLSRSGYLALRQVARLTATVSVVTDGEWSDAQDVLVGVHKHSLYSTWRGEEAGVVLSPETFVVAYPPKINLLRVDPRARTDWQNLLAARTAQRQALVDGSAGAVSAAEQAALPLLRDALLLDIATAEGPHPSVPSGSDLLSSLSGTGLPVLTGPLGPVRRPPVVMPLRPADGTKAGEQMTALFQLDMNATGVLRTSRLAQATETLQSLLFAIRSAELPPTHPAHDWKLTYDIPTFDAAWKWMGEHGTWQSAVQAFLFPERHLDPTLLTAASGDLKILMDAIRAIQPINPADATKKGDVYLTTVAGIKYKVSERSLEDQRALAEASAGLATSREAFWAAPMFIAQRLQASGEYQAALDWYWLLYPYDQPAPVSSYHVINTELANDPARPDLTMSADWTAHLDPFELADKRPAPYTRYTLLAVVRCHLDYADAEFTREMGDSIARARSLYLTARRLLTHPCLQPIPPINEGEPTLPIPELAILTTLVDTQLTKIRQGQNITGAARIQGVADDSPVAVQPTPYRAKTLLERAKQLAAQATQVEAAYLAALEKYDAKTFQIFDAQKALTVAGAQINLQQLRTQEAEDAVVATQTQAVKAGVMVQLYQERIDAPLDSYEQSLLDSFPQLRDQKNVVAVANATISIAQAAASGLNLWNEVLSGGAAGVSASTEIAAAGARVVAESWINNLESQIQANQVLAGIEQRRDEWRTQQTAARQDSLIAAAQVQTARDQAAVASREQTIGELQADQAAATLQFLTTQFTNPDLYLWMGHTLGDVYRYFLQQATATGCLAQAQLAFERAEPEQAIVLNDYWRPVGTTVEATKPDRGGLTGAERLTEDLTRLESYAFSTDSRKLNLSETFSVAQLMPPEFFEFRRTGTLRFATPMGMFDRNFPGHYQRLIRQVHISLVALVPPSRGIRATLYSNGISRVTTKDQDGIFSDLVLRRDPGIVGLTSPINASGVFDLDQQPDMLLPFEGNGVDTTWELELPQAANPFDFTTISDVIVTIEYTALADVDYRTQIVHSLNSNRARGADCLFSLARDFPDAWYTLNNPDPITGRTVTINLRDVDFPPNIGGLAVAGIAVQLVAATTVPDTAVSVTRGPLGGEATTTEGGAGTARGNAASWVPLCGASPVGTWQLGVADGAFPDTAILTDVVLLIRWAGQAPAWPI